MPSCTVWSGSNWGRRTIGSRGPEIGVSQRAFERAAERKEQTLEQAHGLSHGPSR